MLAGQFGEVEVCVSGVADRDLLASFPAQVVGLVLDSFGEVFVVLSGGQDLVRFLVVFRPAPCEDVVLGESQGAEVG